MAVIINFDKLNDLKCFTGRWTTEDFKEVRAIFKRSISIAKLECIEGAHRKVSFNKIFNRKDKEQQRQVHLDCCEEVLGLAVELDCAAKAFEKSRKKEDLSVLQDIFQVGVELLNKLGVKKLSSQHLATKEIEYLARSACLLKYYLLKTETTILKAKEAFQKEKLESVRLFLCSAANVLDKIIDREGASCFNGLEDQLKYKLMEYSFLVDQKEYIINVATAAEAEDGDGRALKMGVDYICKYPKEARQKELKEDFLQLIHRQTEEEVREGIASHSLKKQLMCFIREDALKVKESMEMVECQITQLKQDIKIQSTNKLTEQYKESADKLLKDLDEAFSEDYLGFTEESLGYVLQLLSDVDKSIDDLVKIKTPTKQRQEEAKIQVVLEDVKTELRVIKPRVERGEAQLDSVQDKGKEFVGMYCLMLIEKKKKIDKLLNMMAQKSVVIDSSKIVKIRQEVESLLKLADLEPLHSVLEVDGESRERVGSCVLELQSALLRVELDLIEADVNDAENSVESAVAFMDIFLRTVKCSCNNVCISTGDIRDKIKKARKDVADHLQHLKMDLKNSRRDFLKVTKELHQVKMDVLDHRIGMEARESDLRYQLTGVKKRVSYQSEEAYMKVRARCYHKMTEAMSKQRLKDISKKELEICLEDAITEEKESLEKKELELIKKEKRLARLNRDKKQVGEYVQSLELDLEIIESAERLDKTDEELKAMIHDMRRCIKMSKSEIELLEMDLQQAVEDFNIIEQKKKSCKTVIKHSVRCKINLKTAVESENIILKRQSELTKFIVTIKQDILDLKTKMLTMNLILEDFTKLMDLFTADSFLG